MNNHTDMNNSFTHSDHFYSAYSSPLLLRGTPDTARILCQSFTPKRHRQLRVKDLPMVPTTWPERDLTPRPFGRKATNLPMSHHPLRIIIQILLIIQNEYSKCSRDSLKPLSYSITNIFRN